MCKTGEVLAKMSARGWALLKGELSHKKHTNKMIDRLTGPRGDDGILNTCAWIPTAEEERPFLRWCVGIAFNRMLNISIPALRFAFKAPFCYACRWHVARKTTLLLRRFRCHYQPSVENRRPPISPPNRWLDLSRGEYML